MTLALLLHPLMLVLRSLRLVVFDPVPIDELTITIHSIDPSL